MIDSLIRSQIRNVLKELSYQLSSFYYINDILERQMQVEEDEIKYKQIQKELNDVEDFISSIKKQLDNFALIMGVKYE